jgi:hypothetical protein
MPVAPTLIIEKQCVRMEPIMQLQGLWSHPKTRQLSGCSTSAHLVPRVPQFNLISRCHLQSMIILSFCALHIITHSFNSPFLRPDSFLCLSFRFAPFASFLPFTCQAPNSFAPALKHKESSNNFPLISFAVSAL